MQVSYAVCEFSEYYKIIGYKRDEVSDMIKNLWSKKRNMYGVSFLINRDY